LHHKRYEIDLLLHAICRYIQRRTNQSDCMDTYSETAEPRRRVLTVELEAAVGAARSDSITSAKGADGQR
jgi:hypothetical protein